MSRAGINAQLLVAGVVPAVVVTLAVSAWLVTARVVDLRDHQQRLGQVVASQLAPAAEYGVFAGNRAVLQRLVDAALVEADLRSVTVRDRNGVVLAAAGGTTAAGRDSSGLAAWLVSLWVAPDETARFSAPVISPTTDLGEFDMPGGDGFATIGTVEIEIALLPASARQLDAVLTGVMLALAGLLASLLLARRLGNRIGAPIRRLADAMRRVRDGDLTVRVPEHSNNELGMLESGLNRMADEVQRTQRTLEDQVARATGDLQQTVAALEVSNVELDLARRRALEASHLKGEFLAAMSHEIRTPMSGIIGFTDLLARGELSVDQREQVLTIQKSADTLMRILNDILDLSRIEAGKLVLTEAPLDLRECVDDVLSLLAPLAYAKGLDLRRCVDAAVPRLLVGDRARLQQVLINLVGNAIKYTTDGHVTVEAAPTADGGRFTIAISDSGIGIAAPVQRQLFQAFSQANPSTARYPGAGLGLVICSKLVEAMGGDIELQSEPGAGSRFAVSLALLEAAAEPPPPRWPGRRALLCEADPLTRDHLAQLLRAQGFTVDARARPPHGRADHDLLLLATAGGDDRTLQRFAAAAAGHPAVLVLLGSVAPAALARVRAVLPGPCLPRCLMTESLYRGVAGALGERAAGPAGAPAPVLTGRRLLVVDDHRVNRVLLARQLRALGARVEEVDSGEAALTSAAETTPDAVLLDLQMPGLDGVATARRLRELRPAPLVVAVTANALAGYDPAMRDAGISALLVKPVDERHLIARVLGGLARADLDGLSPDLAGMLAEDLPPLAARWRDARDGETLHALAGIAASARLHALTRAVEAARTGAAAALDAALDALLEELARHETQ